MDDVPANWNDLSSLADRNSSDVCPGVIPGNEKCRECRENREKEGGNTMYSSGDIDEGP